MGESRKPREFWIGKDENGHFGWMAPKQADLEQCHYAFFGPNKCVEYIHVCELLPDTDKSTKGAESLLVGTNFKTEDIKQVADLIKENQDLRERCELLDQVKVANAKQRFKLEKIENAINRFVAMTEHAIAIGHLGEGSTRGWANECLKEAREALKP